MQSIILSYANVGRPFQQFYYLLSRIEQITFQQDTLEQHNLKLHKLANYLPFF